MATPKKIARDEPEQRLELLQRKTKKLMAKFFDLQEQQWQALDREVYCGMTPIETLEYESRALRLNELLRALRENLTYHKDRLQKP